MSLREEIERLRPFAEEPKRSPMSRGVQFPSMQGRVLSLEQELARTRQALKEALALLELSDRSTESFLRKPQ